MDTRKASKASWKHIVCCVVILIIFMLTMGVHINAEGKNGETIADSSSEVVPLSIKPRVVFDHYRSIIKNEVELAGPKEEVMACIIGNESEDNDEEVTPSEIDHYITTYSDDIYFLSKTFGVEYNQVLEDIRNRYYTNIEELEQTNIGYLRNKAGKVKKYKNDLYGLVEYFYDYVEKNPKNVNKKWIPYKGGSKYIENLIIYFTTHVYTNVDTVTALSIGAAESGYYKVKFMLKKNNVYGGMSSKGLIKYKNIEYGVLSYIRTLSKNYYGKGLNTVSKIGKKYCPKYDKLGNKIASPHWIKLVSSAKKKYSKYNTEIETKDLLDKDRITNL